MESWDYLPHLQRGPAARFLAKAEAPRYAYDICLKSKQGLTWAPMACFIGGVESQQTGTLEVNSEGGKPRRGSEERDVDLLDHSLARQHARATEGNFRLWSPLRKLEERYDAQDRLNLETLESIEQIRPWVIPL